MNEVRSRAGAVAVALAALLTACGAGDGTAASRPSAAASAGGSRPPGDGAPGVASAPAAGAAATSPTTGVAQVTFASGDLRLAGDLHMPHGAGPHPGVVLVHGSGPLDRDAHLPGQLGTTFPEPVAVFADLARGLREAGYAVLTYDKRTCGPFNGCADNGYPRPPADLTVDTFVTDATAAVAYLRSRPEVDPDAIAVAGHSQGASFVPAMLLDDPQLSAGVMLSAPFDPIDRVLAAQDPATGAKVTALRSEDVADGTTIAGASAAFWRSWIRVSDGVPQLATQVGQPLLVLGGALDRTVPPPQLARWRKTLTGDDHRVVVLACVSHALNCLATDDLRRVAPDDVGRNVDTRVTATIVDFLGSALP